MALTSPVYKGRLLGQSKMLKLPNRAVWVLNGNNVGVSGDAVRRILPINLCSDENPELRKHGFDPVQVIRAALEPLRADLIDLLATYSAFGRDATGGDGRIRIVRGLEHPGAWRCCVARLGRPDSRDAGSTGR